MFDLLARYAIFLHFKLIHLKGTAPAKYELKPNWSFNDIFTVQEDLTFADSIQPGEEIQFSVTFKPQEEREYLSHFTVTTPSGVVEVGLQGIGIFFPVYIKPVEQSASKYNMKKIRLRSNLCRYQQESLKKRLCST